MWFLRRQAPSYCYLFAHVAKCGGTTLVHAFGTAGRGAICLGDHQTTRRAVRAAAEAEIQNRRLAPDRVELFFGHRVHFGLHELSALPPRYFTFVRHPFQRTISLYNHHCGIADNPRHPFQQRDLSIMGPPEARLTFEQWMLQVYTGNHMVRFLSFAMQGEDATADGEMTESHLEQACRFIDQCWFVGLIERSREDIPFVCRAVGVKPPRKPSNVSTIYQPATDDPELIDLISQRDALDLRLYQHAVARRAVIDEQRVTHQ
ncbi:MAG: sulfotransferase family 2 domain-containing protein [Planctomycetales bacterium]|nr:sulfotransferase family 2 domain-containing protein [Planctomycetales bacterium]